MTWSKQWVAGVGNEFWSVDGDGSWTGQLPRFRSLPDPLIRPEDVAGQGWQRSDLLLPALTLRASALQHNIDLHARWCDSVGVSQAPHAKTHLSPEIARLQLTSGAWGMTVASVHQARILAAAGARTILLAHEVVDPANIRALVDLTSQFTDLVVIPLVDSTAGVELLERHLRAAGACRRLPVLVELGMPGGRTGARSLAEMECVARAVHESHTLTLAGVEGFEGVLPVGRDDEQLVPVNDYLQQLMVGASLLDERGYFEEVDQILITAGGSIYPDRVAMVQRPTLSRPVRVVVRSGGTVTHDHSPSATHAPLAPEAHHPMGALRPALELWAAVVSTPEPGLALANFGKRDAPYDSHVPIVLDVLREGISIKAMGVEVTKMNDQHGYLRHNGELHVGDVLKLGPCHPCTAFDKWTLVPVLDDEDAVVGAVTTWF